MTETPKDDKFSEEEAQRRFETALRVARAVGHKPMSEIKVGKKARPAKATPPRRKAAGMGSVDQILG